MCIFHQKSHLIKPSWSVRSARPQAHVPCAVVLPSPFLPALCLGVCQWPYSELTSGAEVLPKIAEVVFFCAKSVTYSGPGSGWVSPSPSACACAEQPCRAFCLCPKPPAVPACPRGSYWKTTRLRGISHSNHTLYTLAHPTPFTADSEALQHLPLSCVQEVKGVMSLNCMVNSWE